MILTEEQLKILVSRVMSKLNEEGQRVKLKVPAPVVGPSTPPLPLQQPETDMEPEMTDQPIPEPEEKKPFGKEKFDAGIDVDEDADPKNYIEKLTGKLAQKLRSYNETQKDSDLNKFVINSIIPASIPSMDKEDTNDVIKKVEDNIAKQVIEPVNDAPNEPVSDAGNIPEEQPVQQESIEPNIDDLVSEIFSNRKMKTVKNNRKIDNKFGLPKFK